VKALLFGLPVIVEGDGCRPANWLSGLLLEIPIGIFGFNGAVFPYEGSYWKALWDYLVGNYENDEEDSS
jgi:hypothetical protein